MFPGAGAEIHRNEAGEPIGWSYLEEHTWADHEDQMADLEPSQWEEIEAEGYEPTEPVDSPYCDLCEIYGHTFATCPARDDYEDGEA